MSLTDDQIDAAFAAARKNGMHLTTYEAARAIEAAVLAAQSEQPQGNLAVSTAGDVHGEAGREAIGTLCPTAPERIWLQVDPEPQEDGQPVYTGNDITWCTDPINDSDTLYIRADRAGYRRPGAAEGAKDTTPATEPRTQSAPPAPCESAAPPRRTAD